MLDMYGICMDMSPRNIQAAAPPNILLDPKKKVETKQTPGRPWWFFLARTQKKTVISNDSNVLHFYFPSFGFGWFGSQTNIQLQSNSCHLILSPCRPFSHEVMTSLAKMDAKIHSKLSIGGWNPQRVDLDGNLQSSRRLLLIFSVKMSLQKKWPKMTGKWPKMSKWTDFCQASADHL